MLWPIGGVPMALKTGRWRRLTCFRCLRRHAGRRPLTTNSLGIIWWRLGKTPKSLDDSSPVSWKPTRRGPRPHPFLSWASSVCGLQKTTRTTGLPFTTWAWPPGTCWWRQPRADFRSIQGLDAVQVHRTIDMMHDDVRPSEVLTSELLRSSRGRAVRPKTSGQKQYADAIASNIVTFGIGPAGTGKSYLAVALAVQALQAHQVSKIILTRPAVEAGERLGFLPGDLMAKVDPYLRPLYDALYHLLEPEGAQRLLDRGAVEVAPLAFMRGRTLNGSFIILDEAQNTTPEQMKMFLTRIGFGSKAVITGDVTQIDVQGGRSGLVGLETVLGSVEDVEFVHLTRGDVVRHKIVADIVDAYEHAERAKPDSDGD